MYLRSFGHEYRLFSIGFLQRNVINTSKSVDLKLYTIYSPPNHLDKVVRKTKQEALAKEEHYDGRTTE